MKITWNDEWSVGIKEIDDQHKQFIELINNIYEAIEKGDFEKECCVSLDYFANYALYHLSTEEDYFEKFDYDKKEEHIVEHNNYRKEIGKWAASCPSSENRMQLLKEAADFSTTWMIAHILGSDRQYIKCFQENGVE